MKTEAWNLHPHGTLIHRSVSTLSFEARIFVSLRLVRALDDDCGVTGRVFVGHITSPEYARSAQPGRTRYSRTCSSYRENLNNWTACLITRLSPISGVKVFIFVLEGGEGLCFCYVFSSFPDKGILDYVIHSTPSNYSNFYDT